MSKLIFIYNADSGTVNAALDVAHKLFSPDTYSCNLCALTHDTFTERSAWKSFRETHSMPMVFLHRDEYERNRGNQKQLVEDPHYTYPIILKEEQDRTDVFLETTELNQIQDVNDLIATIQQRLS